MKGTRGHYYHLRTAHIGDEQVNVLRVMKELGVTQHAKKR